MARKRAEIEEVPMELTPMIDVVFLLLIFFLVTLKFKVLEGKLPTFLPKDVGVNSAPVDDLLEKVEIGIVKDPSRGAGAPHYGIQVIVNNQRMPSLDAFTQKLRAMRSADDELKSTLYPQVGVNYEQVIKVVDAAVAANMTDITFAGIAFEQ